MTLPEIWLRSDDAFTSQHYINRYTTVGCTFDACRDWEGRTSCGGLDQRHP